MTITKYTPGSSGVLFSTQEVLFHDQGSVLESHAALQMLGSGRWGGREIQIQIFTS
jgi:hypothetical protein